MNTRARLEKLIATGKGMSSDSSRSGKLLTVCFYWAGWLFSYAIRYALGIVAPILMQLYHISPQTMGYILSGWN
jgi:hypothetical protein